MCAGWVACPSFGLAPGCPRANDWLALAIYLFAATAREAWPGAAARPYDDGAAMHHELHTAEHRGVRAPGIRAPHDRRTALADTEDPDAPAAPERSVERIPEPVSVRGILSCWPALG